MIPDHYKEDIEIIKSHGFNLLAVSTMMCEHTFYFNTKEEAISAYNYFEKKQNPESKWLVSGWWYSIEEKEENENWYLEKGYGVLEFYLLEE